MLKKASIGSRYLLGVIFLVFGLNGFLNFIPQGEMPPAAMVFMGGLMSAKYFFPVLKAVEVICGALLLAGMYVPLALVVLAPIVLQIFLFHRFLAPAIPMDIMILAMWVFAAWGYRHVYKEMLKKKSTVQI
ncbi:MAG: DoxX family membrane protein [Bdellovibrionales bacterium]|nr:DoxX family membrane protein [Bdellovibrionales bacterium]